MKNTKWIIFTASIAAIMLSSSNTSKAAHNTELELNGYAPLQQEDKSKQGRTVTFYDKYDFQYNKRSHNLFEQSGGRDIDARIQYFKSDRLQITNDYGGKFVNGSTDSFHTMLRMTLSF